MMLLQTASHNKLSGVLQKHLHLLLCTLWYQTVLVSTCHTPDGYHWDTTLNEQSDIIAIINIITITTMNGTILYFYVLLIALRADSKTNLHLTVTAEQHENHILPEISQWRGTWNQNNWEKSRGGGQEEEDGGRNDKKFQKLPHSNACTFTPKSEILN